MSGGNAPCGEAVMYSWIAQCDHCAAPSAGADKKTSPNAFAHRRVLIKGLGVLCHWDQGVAVDAMPLPLRGLPWATDCCKVTGGSSNQAGSCASWLRMHRALPSAGVDRGHLT